MGSKGGGSQTQRTEPWAGQAPFLQYGFQQAQDLYNTGGPSFFPGATYVPFSSQTEQGLGLTEQRALAGSPVTGAAQGLATNVLSAAPGTAGVPQAATDALTQTAQGQFLNANPFLDEAYNQAAGQVTRSFQEDLLPGISSQFSLAGRAGSPAQFDTSLRGAEATGDVLGRLASNIYGGNYQQERGRQLQAAGQLGGLGTQALGTQLGFAGLSPTLAGQDYADIDRLLGVGGRVEGLGQTALQDRLNRFNFYQNQPQQNLANYIAAIQGNYGGTTSGEPAEPSRLQGAIGGAATGTAVGGFPWGTLIGAGVGAFG